MGPRAHPSAPAARPRARWLAVTAVAVLAAGTLAGPSDAEVARPRQATPDQDAAAVALAETLALAPDAPASPDDPFEAVVTTATRVSETALARLSATGTASRANLAALQAVGERNEAQAVEDAAQQARDDARTELATERDRLADLTVQAYVVGGEVDFEKYREILQGDTSDPAAGRQIMFSQVLDRQQEVTDQARADLKARKAELVVARTSLTAAKATATNVLAEAAVRQREKADAELAHTEAEAEAAAAQATLRSAAGRQITLVPEAVPIIGLPRLSAADLASWFATSPYRPRVSTPITDYATWFIAEGAAEGIRGDIAFAQAVLETGGFANNDSVSANNFSGIGHCDLCPSGWRFPSPELGVRAQIQLLKSYAVRKPNYAHDLVDKRLRGPAGCCPTWGDLTTVWATDPTYGPKVMLIYTSMVSHALGRRAAGLE